MIWVTLFLEIDFYDSTTRQATNEWIFKKVTIHTPIDLHITAKAVDLVFIDKAYGSLQKGRVRVFLRQGRLDAK